MANDWRFKQLGGQQKEIVLSDYAAPMGRPRQRPIFEETLKDRIRTKYYPGNSGVPTRHLFGTQWDDDGRIHLTGRWMDRHLTGTTARALVEKWHDLIRDELRVSVSWGNIASWTGLVESLKTGWESDTEVVWALTILVDERSSSITKPPAPPRNTNDNWIAFNETWAKFGEKHTAIAPDIAPDIFDTIDALFSKVAEATSSLTKIVGQLNDLQNQTFGTLQRLRLAIHEVKTAFINYQEMVDSIDMNAALFTRQSASDLRWFTFRNENDVNYAAILDSLAQMDLAVEQQLRGRDFTTYRARSGDSWESIANEFYGGPEGADKIRQANGVKFGDIPVSGRSYRIPG